MAKRIFSAYLGNFFAHLGPYLGHSGSGKWAKLVSLDVLSAVPTSSQSVQSDSDGALSLNAYHLYRWSHMALLVKMPIDALFWALGGPKYEKCHVHKLEQRSVHLLGAEKTIGDGNGALSLNAYHISQCEFYSQSGWSL